METVLTEKERDALSRIMANGGLEEFIKEKLPVFYYTWSFNLMRIFIDHGTDVNYRTESEVTLLMSSALRYPDSDVIALLLERGADVHLTKHGSTVLDLMFERLGMIIPEHKRIVLLLIKHGAIPVKTWKPDTLIRKFYWDVRSFLALVNTNFVLPIDLLRTLHTFIIG
jgi:hypothetical protein